LATLLQWAKRMFDAISSHLERYLDLLSVRQKLVSSNIANADTPGYKTKDIDFHFEFMSQVEGARPNVIEPDGLTVKNDGNNVNLDREARLLAENAIRFQFAAGVLRAEMRAMKSAIQEGKNG